MDKPFTVKETRRLKESEHGFYKNWDIKTGRYAGVGYFAGACEFLSSEVYQKTDNPDAKLLMPTFDTID